jgi:hypothetical protein
VEAQPFFNTVAGLSISLAGFASVIAWLREDMTAWDPINLWRVKAIVRHALSLAFIALSLWPAYALTSSVATTVRFGSVAIIANEVYEIYRNRRPDPEIWKPQSSWRLFMLFGSLHIVLHLANLVWASVGVLMIGALIMLSSPAGIFSNFVRELGGRTKVTGLPSDGETSVGS